MNKTDYVALYNIQDKILEHLANSEICKQIDVVLAGGTALARGWYQHRESDDLDFFIVGNDFFSDANKLIRALPHDNEIGRIQITEKYETVINLFYYHDNLSSPLKIQIIQSELPYDRENRGKICGFPIESIRDIASDKIAAFCNRQAPKDMADLYQIVTLFEYSSFNSLVSEAIPKGVSISLQTIAKAVDSFDFSSLGSVVWRHHVFADIELIQKTMKEFIKNLIVHGDVSLPFCCLNLKSDMSLKRPGD